MKSIYEECPVLENERFMLRKAVLEDADDLLNVYSDKNALPFFNSDNCNGDNFYYPTEERMTEALKFWETSYENCWFARLSILDKQKDAVIGTIEGVKRASEDAFDGCGILRLDVGSPYEKEEILFDILSVLLKDFCGLFACNTIITKVPVYAVEREKAVRRAGFEKSEELLRGSHDGYGYRDYWVLWA